MPVQPLGGGRAAQIEERGEEIPVGIELTRHAEAGDLLFRADHVEEDAPVASLMGQTMLIEQLCDKGDGAHLAHHGGVEADVLHAVNDGAGRGGGLVYADGIDLDQYDVARLSGIEQRKHGRVPHETPIPITFALNLHGAE